VPNGAYEILFTTNAPKVQREIKGLQQQVSSAIIPRVEKEIKSLHRQFGAEIVPHVDLSQLKALNAELDLKQRHLRQTIAYFKQNQIKASMELSMPAITPATLQKALPSADIKKVAQQQAKQLQDAFRSASGRSGVIDVEIKNLDPAGIEVGRKRLIQLTQLTRRRRAELEEMAALAQKKGIDLPGLQGIVKPTIKQFQQALTQGFEQAGNDAIVGFINALASGNTKAGKAAAGIGKAVLQELKKTIDSHSPSKKTEKEGENLVDGFALGINKHADKAVKAARDVAKEVAAAMNPANIPQGPRRQAAAAAMRTPDLSGSWFTQPAPSRRIADPWSTAQPSPQEREAQMRAQLKAIGITHLEQKVLDELAKSYQHVAEAKAEAVKTGGKGIAGMLPSAGQSSASRMAFADLSSTVLRAPDISKLKADAKKIEASNRSLLELGDRLAATTMRPGYYRRAIRQAGIENLPVDITGLANERALKGFEVGIGRFVKRLPETMQQSIRNQLGSNPKLFIPVETLVRQFTGQKGQLERSLDDALKPSGRTIANNGAEAGKDFSEKLADGITSGASKAIAAAKKLSAQIGAAMGGGGGRGLSTTINRPDEPSASLPRLSGSVLRSYTRRDKLGNVIEEIKGLYNQVNEIDALINRTPINSRRFRSLQASAGFRQGEIERAQNIGQVERLRASSRFFEEGSLTRLNKELQALQIEASQIKPDTKEWSRYQEQISRLTIQMGKLGEKAEAINARVRMGAAAPGSINQLEARLQQYRSEIHNVSATTSEYRKLNRQIQRTEQQMDRITRKPLTMGERSGAAAGAVLYGGGLAGSPLSAIGGLAGGLMGGIPGSFTGAAIGQTGDQLLAAANASATYAASLSRLRIALAGVSGSFENYQANLKAINSISNTFGMSIDKVIQPYTKLQASVLAAGYSAQTTKDIFEGVTAASIATGGSAEDLEGSMRAVTQIFAKGTVQSEELVGQLSERIPGAFALFARFNNMSTASLKDALERGQVGLDNFIKFNKGLLETYGQSAREIAKGPEYAGQRLEAALKRLQGSVGGALAPIGAAFQEWAAGVVGAFDQIIKKMQQYGVLSNQLSSSGIVEDVLAGRRTRKSVTDEISRLRKEEEARNKAQTPFSQFVAKGTSRLGSAMGPLRFLPSNPLIPSSISATLLDQFFNSARNRQEGELSAMSKAEADLKRLDEQIKNGAKEQAALAADERKKELISLAERYGELMKRKEEELAMARKDYENNLQDLRKRHADEMQNFEESLTEQRRSAELDIARIRRDIVDTSVDAAEAQAISSALLNGQDISALREQARVSKVARENREAITRLEEDNAIKQDKRQKDLDKMRNKNAQEINKLAEDNALKVKKIGEEHAKNVRDLIVDTARKQGQTMTSVMRSINLQYEMMLISTQRLLAGLHPRYENVDQQIVVPRIADIEKMLSIPAEKRLPPEPAPGQSAGKYTGKGGPDLPDWVMAQAKPKPVEIPVVKESDKLYPADNKTHFPYGPDGPTVTNKAGRVISGPTPEMKRLQNTESGLVTITRESQQVKNYADELKRVSDLLDGSLGEMDRKIISTNQSFSAQERLLTNKINPALVDELGNQDAVFESLRKTLEIQKEGYKESKKLGTISLQQYEALTKEADKTLKKIDEQEPARRRNLIASIEQGAALKYNLELAKEYAMLGKAPGLQQKLAEVRLAGIEDPQKALQFAQKLLDVDKAKAFQSQLTNLGDTISSTLAPAIVNLATVWSDFNESTREKGEKLKDFINRMATSILAQAANAVKDAFKQMAASVIQGGLDSLKNQGLSFLFNVLGLSKGGPQSSIESSFNGFSTDTGIDTSQFMLGNQRAFKFANGGIVTGPTLGLIGEGRYNEAIIPMPNNRAVPVDLKGAVGSTYNSPITVNISNSSAGATAESQITGDQGNKLAGVLDKAVKQAILSEQRPGGLLYRQ